MQGIVYEEASMLTFVFVTILLGGLGAWMTGRACARTWRPKLIVAIYTALLGLGVRFIHFSIFSGTLLSAHYYLVDTIVLEIIAFTGFQFTRTKQMVTQYYWLYEAAGPLSWRSRA